MVERQKKAITDIISSVPNLKMNLRTIIISILFLSCQSLFAQTSNDTIKTLELQTKKYLTEMYIDKNIDNASEMWDSRMLLEMEDFYNKRNQGQLTDTILYNRIKQDINKYYKQLTTFRFDKFLKSSIERGGGFILGYVIFEYTEFFKSKSMNRKTMIVFISQDNGKTWVLQDWKVKDIADKVDRKISFSK
jgi:hypothetical protein